MGVVKRVHGVPWADGVIANCRWTGARLSDILKYAGITETAKHICFESHATLCQDDTCYGASIPVSKACKKEEDVLIAYEVRQTRVILMSVPDTDCR